MEGEARRLRQGKRALSQLRQVEGELVGELTALRSREEGERGRAARLEAEVRSICGELCLLEGEVVEEAECRSKLRRATGETFRGGLEASMLVVELRGQERLAAACGEVRREVERLKRENRRLRSGELVEGWVDGGSRQVGGGELEVEEREETQDLERELERGRAKVERAQAEEEAWRERCEVRDGELAAARREVEMSERVACELREKCERLRADVEEGEGERLRLVEQLRSEGAESASLRQLADASREKAERLEGQLRGERVKVGVAEGERARAQKELGERSARMQREVIDAQRMVERLRAEVFSSPPCRTHLPTHPPG